MTPDTSVGPLSLWERAGVRVASTATMSLPQGARMSTLIADWRDRPTHRKVWALAAPMTLSNISVPLVALVDSLSLIHI